MNIGAIREALAAVVQIVTDSSEHPANVHAYPSGTPLMPAVLVFPAPFEDGQYVNYWQSYGDNLCAVGLRLEVRISANDEDAARTLDTYLSTIIPDILTEIKADPTLGGVCEVVLGRDSTVPAEFAPAEGDARTWLSSSVAFEIRARRSTP